MFDDLAIGHQRTCAKVDEKKVKFPRSNSCMNYISPRLRRHGGVGTPCWGVTGRLVSQYIIALEAVRVIPLSKRSCREPHSSLRGAQSSALCPIILK